jgi:sugar phosphate isomerase/epimerase
MILMHSYTYRAYDFERACRKARAYGWDGLELCPTLFRGRSLADIKPELADTMRRCGVCAPVASWSADVIQDDREAAKASLDALIGGLPLLCELGVEKINSGVGVLRADDPLVTGSAIAKEEHYERAAEAFRTVAPVLSELGMTCSFEIHMHTLHDTAGSTLKLLDMIDSPLITANIDAGNMYGTPHAEEAVEAIRILSGRIGYVHAKNCRRLATGGTDYSYMLDNGHLDYFRIFRALHDTGYRGHVCCEYCGLGDPSVAAQRDLAYLKSTMHELGMR